MLTYILLFKLSVWLAVVGSVGSILWRCIYNLFYHPYSKYPGPFLARISPFHALWHAYIGDLHLDALRCHQTYGPFVRYAPDRLLVNTADGMKSVYGQGKNFKKSHGYAPHPYFPKRYNTHNCIDKEMHGRKRRIVAQGFSESTMAASEQYVLTHVRNLCAKLVEDAGSSGWSQPKDMAHWTNYFTLDVISDLTFGKPLNMLTDDSMRWLMDAIVEGNRHIYMRFACPWLFNVNPRAWYAPARWLFPGLASERTGFVDVANQYSKERMSLVEAGGLKRQDILSALMDAHDPKTGEQLSQDEIWTEAHLMIAAGGDTTSTAFAAVLFYLSRNGEQYRELSQEIRSTFNDTDEIHRGSQLSGCRYLKACIDEALRLAPAAPGALWRESGVGGARVDGEYIPQGLDVGTCVYALQHDAQYFHEPFAFKPERFFGMSQGSEHFDEPFVFDPDRFFANWEWDRKRDERTNSEHFSSPEQLYRDNINAYAPFSIGSRSCPAKPLAYLELALALAHIMFLFDFEAVDSLGEGGPGKGRGRERVEEFQVIDMFSSNKEGPVLKFRSRRRPSLVQRRTPVF